jgi:hypothetical protein
VISNVERLDGHSQLKASGVAGQVGPAAKCYGRPEKMAKNEIRSGRLCRRADDRRFADWQVDQRG